MHGVIPEVEEEWFAFVLLDETDGAVGQNVSEVITFLPAFHARDIGRGMLVALVGEMVRARLPHLVSGNVEVESVGLRVVVAAALVMGLKVPLADVGSGVARLFQGLGEGGVFKWHVASKFRWGQPMARAEWTTRAAVVSQMDPARILPGQDTRTGRRADRVRGVGISEKCSAAGKPVYIRRFVEGAAGDPEIRPPEVIDQKENDIRASGVTTRGSNVRLSWDGQGNCQQGGAGKESDQHAGNHGLTSFGGNGSDGWLLPCFFPAREWGCLLRKSRRARPQSSQPSSARIASAARALAPGPPSFFRASRTPASTLER